jgi:hypothetical protein
MILPAALAMIAGSPEGLSGNDFSAFDHSKSKYPFCELRHVRLLGTGQKYAPVRMKGIFCMGALILKAVGLLVVLALFGYFSSHVMIGQARPAIAPDQVKI